MLAVAALAGAVVSALASPRRAMSLDALRGLLVFSLLLPLGASRVTARYGAAAPSALPRRSAPSTLTVSLLQGWGIYRPLPIEVTGARGATGAFAGNVGYLALALALAGVAALGARARAPPAGHARARHASVSRSSSPTSSSTRT